VKAGTPLWALGGTIRGGTLETGDGRTIHVPYIFGAPGGRTYQPRLDHVIMNADLVVDNNTLMLADGILDGHGSVLLYPLAGLLPGRIASDTSTLMIGSGITIRSGGGSSTNIGVSPSVGQTDGFSSALVNHGTLRATQPALFSSPEVGLNLFGLTIFNDGTLVIDDKGFMNALREPQGSQPNTLFTFGSGGTLDIDLSANANLGLLRVTGTLDLSTSGDELALSRSTGTSDGTFYRIVTTTVGITGQFDSVTPGFEVEYRNGNEIWARFVPEPGSLAVLIIVVGLGAARRRRRGAAKRDFDRD